jgi:hypothetical protein
LQFSVDCLCLRADKGGFTRKARWTHKMPRSIFASVWVFSPKVTCYRNL